MYDKASSYTEKLETVLHRLADIDRAENYAEVSEKIRALLGAVGGYTGATGVYVFERAELTEAYHIAFEWRSPRKTAWAKVRNAAKELSAAEIPYLENEFREGRGVVIDREKTTDARMSAECALLRSRGIDAGFFVPVSYKKKIVGFLGMNDPDIRHSADYMNLLQVVGRHLGSVWENYRTVALLERDQNRLRATEKALAEEQLFLEVFTRDYTSAFYFDLISGKGRALKLDRQANARHLVEGTPDTVNYETVMRLYTERFLIPESAPDFWEQLCPENLCRTLSARDRMSIRFRSVPNAAGQQYFELQAVRVRGGESEFPVMLGFRHIDDIVAREQLHQEALERALAAARLNNEIISAISKIYSSIFRIDIPNDRYDEVSGDTETHHFTGVTGRASTKMAELCDAFVTPEYHDRVLHFFDISTLPERLAEEETTAIEFLSKEGKWMLARFIAKKRNAEGKLTHALYVTRSIEDTKRREQDWIAIAEEANRANTAKTDFLSRMAHDIRTPMNAVRGFTEITLANLDNPQMVREGIEKIDIAGKYLQQLVDDVLDLSRIESGQMRICPAPVDVRELYDGFAQTIECVMPNKRLNFHCSLGVLLYPTVLADSLRIRQVYINLLSNAVKYTPDGGDVFFTLTQQPDEDGKTVILAAEIRDTGIGMSKEFMEKMYLKFTRSVDTRVNAVRGSGLGLSIVRRLVDLMGGTIRAESEPGKGTAFTVSFPLPVATKETATQENGTSAAEFCRGMRLLVAEDNELNFEVIATLLAARGITCDRAEDGSVCVEKFRSAPPDTYHAILMDVMMPVMDGVQATVMIRRLSHPRATAIPIIAMTANAPRANCARGVFCRYRYRGCLRLLLLPLFRLGISKP